MKYACPWEEIDRFHSLVEFRGFERWIAGQVHAGMARQVPVGHPAPGLAEEQTATVEVWYLHVMSREVWRLVWPEPPCEGLFVRVQPVSRG